MIHVVHVVTRINIGGPSVILESILSDSSNEVRYTVVHGKTDTTEGDYFDGSVNDVRLVAIEGLGRSISPIADLRACVQLIKILRALSPDVVHTHMAKAGVLGRLSAWIARVPIRVHTYHGHLLYGYFSPFKTRLIIFVERLLSRITNFFVVVGTQTQSDLTTKRIITLSSSRVLFPGVEIHDLVNGIDRCGIPIHKFIVGFVGRLTSIKRPDRFLEMAELLLSQRDDVEFIIVGDGPLKSEVSCRAESLSQVHILGWRRDVAALLRATDVIVLCSENEGIPLSLIEAASLGVPIVATDVGSVRDIVQNFRNGFLTSKSPNAIADATSLLLNNVDVRRSFGAHGKLYTKQKFRVPHVQQFHRQLYKDLLNQK
jgi:glycosyltransferase involved in cell wall biosynthesis